MCKRTLACLLMLCLIPAMVQAQAPSPCSSPGYAIGYFNGVKNTRAGAGQSRDRLKLIYGSQYNNQPVKYYLFYNPTDGLLADLAEAFKQKEAENPDLQGRWELIWDVLRGQGSLIDRFVHDFPSFDLFAFDALRETAVDLSRDYVDKLVTEADFQSIVDGFVETMTGLTTEQEKILAVAHSQGNLFVNEVYSAVSPTLQTHSLAVVHVATVSSTLNGEYTTSDTDLVVAAVRALLGDTPAANVTVPIGDLLGNDLSGHGFLEIYMNGSLNPYSKIKGDMDAALASLEDPNTQGSSGLFTVTLTWDGTGDVDLHLFEPDGSHVYYANRQGTTGYLDTDNVTAYGPEHYYASCDPAAIQEGTYQVGINNYARATGRIASVQLVTPTRIYSPSTLDVGPERGSSGNADPIPVFQVVVTKNSDGTYTVVQQ